MIPSKGPGFGAGQKYTDWRGVAVDTTLGGPRRYRRMTHRWTPPGKYAPGDHAAAWRARDDQPMAPPEEAFAGFVLHMTDSSRWMTLTDSLNAVNTYGANDPDGAEPWCSTTAEVERALERLREQKLVLRDDDCMYLCPITGALVELDEDVVRFLHGFDVTPEAAARTDAWAATIAAPLGDRACEVPFLARITYESDRATCSEWVETPPGSGQKRLVGAKDGRVHAAYPNCDTVCGQDGMQRGILAYDPSVSLLPEEVVADPVFCPACRDWYLNECTWVQVNGVWTPPPTPTPEGAR